MIDPSLKLLSKTSTQNIFSFTLSQTIAYQIFFIYFLFWSQPPKMKRNACVLHKTNSETKKSFALSKSNWEINNWKHLFSQCMKATILNRKVEANCPKKSNIIDKIDFHDTATLDNLIWNIETILDIIFSNNCKTKKKENKLPIPSLTESHRIFLFFAFAKTHRNFSPVAEVWPTYQKLLMTADFNWWP